MDGRGLLCSHSKDSSETGARGTDQPWTTDLSDPPEPQEERTRLHSFPPWVPGSSLGTGSCLVWGRREKTKSKSGFFWLLPAYRFKIHTRFTCRFIFPVMMPLFIQLNTPWWLCSCSFSLLLASASLWTEIFPPFCWLKGTLGHGCRNVSLAGHQMDTPNQRLSCWIRTQKTEGKAQGCHRHTLRMLSSLARS